MKCYRMLGSEKHHCGILRTNINIVKSDENSITLIFVDDNIILALGKDATKEVLIVW